MQKHHKGEKRHVQWDEQKLKETEKFRGTFQKINQPKTPYHGNSSQSDDENQLKKPKSQDEIMLDQSLSKAKLNSKLNSKKKADLKLLNQKLNEQLIKFKQHGNQELSQQQLQNEEQKKKKKEQFKKKRNSHYNQFQMIQKMKQKQYQQEDDNL